MLYKKDVITFFGSLFASCLAVPPHIVHIVVDDLGWAEVGYHNKLAGHDIKTPNIDRLAANGLELDRFYTEKICSPSRSSLLTGRFGIHVNLQNVFPEINNPDDTDGGYQGIPINMTGIAQRLGEVGYKNHIVGKWDVGMATDMHSPGARGFDTWLGYWHHSNDYWTQNQEQCYHHDIKDLWRYNLTTNEPAKDLRNGPTCSVDNQIPSNGDTCVYEERIFVDEVKSIISTHSPSVPLFLFYSMHLVHMPLQPLQAALDEFAFIDDPNRRKMHAMVYTADTIIGEVEQALRRAGLWDNALLVIHSDNGGEIMTEFCGGNNYPLRGGKFSQFEGGVRAVSLVSGGHLPPNRRGQRETGLMSIADWYSTYMSVAGIPQEAWVDKRAMEAGLPPLDSEDCWPLIAGGAPCRREIPIGDSSAVGFNQDGDALVGALIQDHYKLLLGPANKGYRVSQDVITGVLWPNTSVVVVPELHPRVCNRDPFDEGCLFDIYTDPGESVNLAKTMPDLFLSLLARLDEVQETVYSPDRGRRNPKACEQAVDNGGYWGTFL